MIGFDRAVTRTGAEAVLDGRFRIDTVLRATAGRSHASGTDLRTGLPVAVESAPADAVSPGTLMRLEHARSAIGTRAPAGIAPVIGMGIEGDAIHLVTPRADGVGLGGMRGAPLSVADAISVGTCVLSALAELHARGVLHRDVTPFAVTLVPGDEVTAVLTAVGLAADAALLGPITDLPAEEVEHLAPEASGALPGGVDERSDLYSVGALIYLLVAGRPPITASTAAGVLREALTATVAPLRTPAPHAPRGLEQIVARLLRRDPRDRYQTARAAAADLGALAAGLARGEDDPEVVVGAHDSRSTLTEPAFVGRRSELGVLRGHVEAARDGRGGLVLVEAPSGGGKSRLLEEIGRAGAESGMWVLHGGGVDQAAARPFQLIDGVVGDIVRAAERDDALRTALAERLGDDAGAACAAMPALAAVLGAEHLHPGPEEHGEARSMRAMVTLLDAVADPGRPAVVIIDDAQWADDLSLRLLAEWCDGRMAGAAPILVLVAFRGEEVAPEHELRAIEALDHVVLPPLGPEEIGNLATTMAGALPAAALAAIGRLSGGNPFMATAALRGLVESATIEPHREGWRIADGALEDVSSTSEAADLLLLRMDLLPAPVSALLTAGAVLGKDFDLRSAAELADLAPGAAVEALTEARRRHIVWAAAADERVTFVHDKLREALLALADDGETAALHLAAARRIERHDPDLSFDLAYHYAAAGDHASALPHALRAATLARERHALAAAERHYAIAERAGAALDQDTRRRIAEGLGDVLMLAGRYEEAQAHLEQARAMSRDGREGATIDGRLGELAFKRGDIETACAAYERALLLLGHRVPASTPGLIAGALREIVVQAAHSLLPRLLVGRRPAPPADGPEMLAVRLYSRVAYPYWFGRGAVPTLWAHLRGMNLAERYEPTPELAQAWSEHAPVMTVLPWFGRAIRYAERSLAIRRDRGDLWGQGQSLHFYGVALYGASRYAECIERCEEAVRLLERTGDRWEMNTASWHIAMCDYRLGNLPAAARRAQEVHRQGREIGDAQAAGISLGIWARATRGAVPAALVATELERNEGDIHTRAELVMAEAIRLMRAGRPGPAARMLGAQLRVIERRGFRQEYVAPVSAWLATALRMRLEEAPALSRSRRLLVARRARRAARRAVWWARGYRNNLPHALREQALVLALTGSGARAGSLLERSAAEAERQGAAYELALTRRAQARLGLEAGRDDAPEEMREAEEALRRLLGESALDPRAPAALSLADRFDAVLSCGRRIASSLEPDAVFEAVRASALALLRPERADVVAVSVLRAEAAGEPADAAALERLLAARSPEVDEPSGGGSRLRMTILADGAPAALLTVEHGGVTGLFGPEEMRLAEYVAALAGAALENAETTAQLEHQAFHDPLTGLPNRALVRDRIDLALKRSARSGRPVSVLLLDLDDFKNVNDSLGHAAGDRLLTEAADRLRAVLRPADTPARLGGDEFAVLLEDADAAAAARVASRVLDGFREPFTLDAREVFVSATIGIVSATDGESGADGLLRDADAAMYSAKARGKRAYEIFVPEMRSAAVARLELGSSLRRALEQEEIELHYQPILDIGTGEVVAVEALARWRHPELGLLPPADFIPLAEGSGLIEQIGAWVLRRACQDLAVLRAEPGARQDMSVSVNLSPRQLRTHSLADHVRDALRQAGIPPGALVLEITETAIAGDTPAGISVLRALRRIGVRVAVDDFGSGYSSLGQLRRLPVNLLKIDRDFLADAGSPEAASFLRAIVELSRGLGLGVVTEGVENEQQLSLAREVHCGLGQGWLWARAMPLDATRTWLREEAAERRRV